LSLIIVARLIGGLVLVLTGAIGIFLFLRLRAAEVNRWLSAYAGWFPPFKVATDPHAAVVPLAVRFFGSTAIAGLVVAMMVTPMACAVMRGVFAPAPMGEREGALALGATRWGVIRSVVLPFGRGGVLQTGSLTVSSLIALRRGRRRP
jgi:phosphate transport system permease protein